MACTHLGDCIRSHGSERLFHGPGQGGHSAGDEDDLLLLALPQKGEERGRHPNGPDDVGIMDRRNGSEVLPVR